MIEMSHDTATATEYVGSGTSKKKYVYGNGIDEVLSGCCLRKGGTIN